MVVEIQIGWQWVEVFSKSMQRRLEQAITIVCVQLWVTYLDLKYNDKFQLFPIRNVRMIKDVS